jgi:hypothetical protein
MLALRGILSGGRKMDLAIIPKKEIEIQKVDIHRLDVIESTFVSDSTVSVHQNLEEL